MNVRVLALVVLFFIPAFSQGPQQQCRMMSGSTSGAMSGATMTKRAEIKVIPMAQYNEDKAAIEKLSVLLTQLRENRITIKKTDSATQKQLQIETELTDLLDAHLRRTSSDEGKSETAVSVQKKLNAMEGKMMCGACHGMGGPMQGGQ